METKEYPTEQEIDILLSDIEVNSLPTHIVQLFVSRNTRFACLEASKEALDYLHSKTEELTDENVSSTFAYIVLKTLRVWKNEDYTVPILEEITREKLQVLTFRELRSYILNIEQNNFRGWDKVWKEKLSKVVINFFIKSGLDLEAIYNDPLNNLQFTYRQ